MNDDKKIQIGKSEYIICTNDNQEKYLYKYDTEHKTGIKLTFSNQETESIKNKIIQTLSNQYIQKVLLHQKT